MNVFSDQHAGHSLLPSESSSYIKMPDEASIFHDTNSNVFIQILSTFFFSELGNWDSFKLLHYMNLYKPRCMILFSFDMNCSFFCSCVHQCIESTGHMYLNKYEKCWFISLNCKKLIRILNNWKIQINLVVWELFQIAMWVCVFNLHDWF